MFKFPVTDTSAEFVNTVAPLMVKSPVIVKAGNVKGPPSRIKL